MFKKAHHYIGKVVALVALVAVMLSSSVYIDTLAHVSSSLLTVLSEGPESRLVGGIRSNSPQEPIDTKPSNGS